MAIKPPIPTGATQDPCNLSPIYQWHTATESILFFQYQDVPPELTPKYRLFRGILEECGVTTRWGSLTCVPQLEQDPSFIHSFQLPTRPPGSRIFYRVTTSCTPTTPISYTPPLEFLYPDCDVTGSFVKLLRDTDTLSSTIVECTFDYAVAGNGSLFQNGHIVFATSGLQSGYAYGTIYAVAPFGAATFRISIERQNPGARIAEKTVTLGNGGEAHFVLNYHSVAVSNGTRMLLQAQRIGLPFANVGFRADPLSPCVLVTLPTTF